MAWIVEVTYESTAGVRHDYETQLRADGLIVPAPPATSLEPFDELSLVLRVDGVEPLRAAARLTACSPESLCVEIEPEARPALAQAVAQLCEGAAGSTARRAVRVYDDVIQKIEDVIQTSDNVIRDAPKPPSLDRRILGMSVGEKVRLAAQGGREERALLQRDRAGAVQSSIVRNPRVTVDELLALARAPHLAPETAETLAQHPTHGSSAQLVFALVRNPRTPLPLAVELVGRLLPSDLRVVAKGLGVRGQVAQAARKRLFGT